MCVGVLGHVFDCTVQSITYREFMCSQQLDDLAEYRAALKEVNVYVAQKESLISGKLDSTGRFDNPEEEL